MLILKNSLLNMPARKKLVSTFGLVLIGRLGGDLQRTFEKFRHR